MQLHWSAVGEPAQSYESEMCICNRLITQLPGHRTVSSMWPAAVQQPPSPKQSWIIRPRLVVDMRPVDSKAFSPTFARLKAADDARLILAARIPPHPLCRLKAIFAGQIGGSGQFDSEHDRQTGALPAVRLEPAKLLSLDRSQWK